MARKLDVALESRDSGDAEGALSDDCIYMKIQESV